MLVRTCEWEQKPAEVVPFPNLPHSFRQDASLNLARVLSSEQVTDLDEQLAAVVGELIACA
jgi:hypothetical protein